MRSTAQPQALDGLLIADFSRVLAGPYLTMLLSDMGATVIKVEGPDGDQTRGWGPPWRDDESTYYQSVNRNKHSVVLDLGNSEDRKLAHELSRRADILVENLLPHRMAKFGLDYESVSKQNERIIYCSISGFGSHPIAASLPGFDLVAQAVSGLMSVTGAIDGEPTKVGVAVVDIVCGLHAGVGVLAALSARERLGRGQLIEVNLLTSALSLLANQGAGYLLAGQVPHRAGNAHPSVAPYEVFPAKDGDVVIAAGTEIQFRRLSVALGLPELADDPRFATNSVRVLNRLELRDLIVGALAGRTRNELVGQLEEAGVPAGPVNDVSEAFQLAERLGLDALWSIGGLEHVRSPMSMSVTPPRAESAPPRLDESGAAVRAWLAESDASPLPARSASTSTEGQASASR